MPGPDEGSFAIDAGEVRVTLDLHVYRMSAIQKTAYRLAARCTAVIGVPEGDLVRLRLLFPNGTTESAAREATSLFFQELLDQELREKIAEEVGPVRALLLAHAFSRTNLLRDP